MSERHWLLIATETGLPLFSRAIGFSAEVASFANVGLITALYSSALTDDFTLQSIESSQTISRTFHDATRGLFLYLLTEKPTAIDGAVDALYNSLRLIHALMITLVPSSQLDMRRQSKVEPLKRLIRPHADAINALNVADKQQAHAMCAVVTYSQPSAPLRLHAVTSILSALKLVSPAAAKCSALFQYRNFPIQIAADDDHRTLDVQDRIALSILVDRLIVTATGSPSSIAVHVPLRGEQSNGAGDDNTDRQPLQLHLHCLDQTDSLYLVYLTPDDTQLIRDQSIALEATRRQELIATICERVRTEESEFHSYLKQMSLTLSLLTPVALLIVNTHKQTHMRWTAEANELTETDNRVVRVFERLLRFFPQVGRHLDDDAHNAFECDAHDGRCHYAMSRQHINLSVTFAFVENNIILMQSDLMDITAALHCRNQCHRISQSILEYCAAFTER